jgi:hypothetical protein
MSGRIEGQWGGNKRLTKVGGFPGDWWVAGVAQGVGGGRWGQHTLRVLPSGSVDASVRWSDWDEVYRKLQHTYSGKDSSRLSRFITTYS